MDKASETAGGYITDLPYQFRYHRELNPAIHAFVQTVLARDPAYPAHGALTAIELGCGFGLSTLIHAAGNPNGRFIGVDFNPQHIASARWLAMAAGLTNVEFIEASFADLERQTLPDFDVIALHGVWSWVDQANRDIITRFAERKLKDGGTFYVSYNALPALAPIMPARRLMWDAFRSATGSTVSRVEAAVARGHALLSAKAGYLTGNPRAAQVLERALGMTHNYLAHEYFNDSWDAFYHADVAAGLKPAGLSFIGSAHILSNIDRVNLTPEAEQTLATITDPTERETLRDYFTVQDFRRDLFIRNLKPMGDTSAALYNTRFAAMVEAQDLDTVRGLTALGEITPLRAISEPVMRVLVRGPASILDLMRAPECAHIGPVDIFDVLLMLTAMGGVEPAAPVETYASRKVITDRLNVAFWDFALKGDSISANVSPLSGGGVNVPQVDQLMLLCRHRGEDPSVFLKRIFGDKIEGDIAAQQAHFEQNRLPYFQRIGIV